MREREREIGINQTKRTGFMCWKLQNAKKEIKDDRNKWIDIPYSWSIRLKYVNPPLIDRDLMQFLTKCQHDLFYRYCNNILTFIQKGKITTIAKAIFEKIRKSGKNQFT